MRVRRIDVGGTLDAPRTTSAGFVELDSYPTRAGVFRYQNDDGSERLELRHPDDVFDPGSLATMAGAAVTDNHPPVPVTPKNFHVYGRGVVNGHPKVEGALVRAPLLVTHAALLDLLARREKQELSCGYEADVTEEAGEYEGEKYTHRQRGIVYNHVAVVDAGRAGPQCAMRLDSKGDVVTPRLDSGKAKRPNGPPKAKKDQENPPMEEVEITLSGKTFKVPKEVAEAINAELSACAAKLADANAKATKAGEVAAVAASDQQRAASQVSALNAKVDSLSAELSDEKRKHADAVDPVKVRERMDARLGLERAARPHLGEKYDYSKKTDMELRVDALKKVLGDGNKDLVAKLEAAQKAGDQSYVAALFDARVDGARPGDMERTEQLTPDPDFVAKRAAASRDAWKKNQ